eukprot:UN01483
MVKCPLMDLFKLIYEVELFPLWFPMMADNAREVHEWNRFSKAVVSQVQAIWPFANRELLLAAKGIDNSPNGSVLINLRDLPETDPHWFPVTKGAVRCKMLHGGFILVPTSKDTTQVSFFANVDPDLSLPTSLMNYVTGKMVGMLIPIMQDNAPKTRGEKSKWYASVTKHSDVYNDIEAKMQLFFPDYDGEEKAKDRKEEISNNIITHNDVFLLMLISNTIITSLTDNFCFPPCPLKRKTKKQIFVPPLSTLPTTNNPIFSILTVPPTHYILSLSFHLSLLSTYITTHYTSISKYIYNT